METVGHARHDCGIVGDNNLLLLFARARAWATLALADPGPFEPASEIGNLKTRSSEDDGPIARQQLYSSG